LKVKVFKRITVVAAAVERPCLTFEAVGAST
jgi:hypothetical protein